MSEDSIQEAKGPAGDASEAQPKARKAAKKVAKKAARKAAKKTAKKAARKLAAKKAKSADAAPMQEMLPLDESPRKAPAVESDPAPASEGPAGGRDPKVDEISKEPPVRFGRVPGGGPVDKRTADEPGGEPAPEARRENRDAERADDGGNRQGEGKRRKRRRKRRRNRGGNGEGGSPDESQEMPAAPLEGPSLEVAGLLELAPKGFGFLRVAEKNFEQARDDVFVPPDMARACGLRVGVWIEGLARQGGRGLQLVEIKTINGLTPEESRKLPAFEELKAVNPNKRISFETTPDRYTTRVVDLVSPVGRGQRGLIVSPPRSGKTTLLLHIAEAVRELHDETLHLMVLLVDERPEEVTEFRRSLPGAEIYASSNDEQARNHQRISELCIERAKRLVEAGKHVFLLMDSITRLARAYNTGMRGRRGRGIGSGGIMVGALETPRRLFAAARNTRDAGSLTILATALVQTNSRADDAIFQEFKGTGNMELVLDRKIAESYVYPAVDIFKSGTRREELLLPEHTLHKIHMIRRGLSGHRPLEAMERLLFFLKKFPNNPQMLLEIKG